MEIGERDLSGGDQVVSLAGLEEILFELREVARADEGALTGEEGRHNLCVAVLAGVCVEHEVDE